MPAGQNQVPGQAGPQQAATASCREEPAVPDDAELEVWLRQMLALANGSARRSFRRVDEVMDLIRQREPGSAYEPVHYEPRLANCGALAVKASRFYLDGYRTLTGRSRGSAKRIDA